MNDGRTRVNEQRTTEILELAWRKFRISATTAESAAAQLFMRDPGTAPMDPAEAGRIHDALVWSIGVAEPQPGAVADLPDWLLLTWASRRPSETGDPARDSRDGGLAAALSAEIGKRRLNDRLEG